MHTKKILFAALVALSFSCSKNKESDIKPKKDIEGFRTEEVVSKANKENKENSSIKIAGLTSHISSTGIVAYDYPGSPKGSELLTKQELYDLINKSSISAEEKKWADGFISEVNKAREAYRNGAAAWESYLKDYLGVDLNKKLVQNQMSYAEVSNQISKTGHNPQDVTYDEQLTIGCYKWSVFYLSHVNRIDKWEFYATVDGRSDSAPGKKTLDGHGDFSTDPKRWIGFELSKKEEKGSAEIMGPRWKADSDPKNAVKGWIVDDGNGPANKGTWGHRQAILNEKFTKAGGYGDSVEGAGMGRFK
ncbi:hypothetical protein [Flammeovirga kamogawensis]|uniref:CAP domain-containing protein n=1 Tax=Flammeovirga kamogawensis TaxID=373891 RepID=A0ABX8GQU7_9BACT|nr:hypothetical protein [Flammeovirga kamogawensis]MBB6463041.1 hypothetical protein [Flammeovirga kamogawensis]QWG05678.1 hypothetical protein KM029_09810 [Flammeovirga kamogawensis]TRX67508.1 hypothetical protein EO216_04845 [Flammeovirga kamogawensis]